MTRPALPTASPHPNGAQWGHTAAWKNQLLYCCRHPAGPTRARTALRGAGIHRAARSMTQFLPRQKDQHFLVTGAGTGIGRAIAIRLASEGATLSLVGRTTATLEETAEQIDALGGSAQVLAADVGDRDRRSYSLKLEVVNAVRFSENSKL